MAASTAWSRGVLWHAQGGCAAATAIFLDARRLSTPKLSWVLRKYAAYVLTTIMLGQRLSPTSHRIRGSPQGRKRAALLSAAISSSSGSGGGMTNGGAITNDGRTDPRVMEKLQTAGAHVVAPCTHDATCPLKVATVVVIGTVLSNPRVDAHSCSQPHSDPHLLQLLCARRFMLPLLTV